MRYTRRSMYISIFIFEIICLLLLSRVLTRTLSSLLYTVFKKESMTIMLLAILFLPGVIIHELSHFLVATILFVKTGTIEFMPVVRGGVVKLGSVEVAHTDPIRRLLIGIAPIVVGVVLLLATIYYLTSIQLAMPAWVQMLLLGIIVFELANTMSSSRKDMEGVWPLVIFVVVLVVVGLVIGIPIPLEWISYLNQASMQQKMYYCIQVLFVPIGIDVGAIVLSKLLLRSSS